MKTTDINGVQVNLEKNLRRYRYIFCLHIRDVSEYITVLVFINTFLK